MRICIHDFDCRYMPSGGCGDIPGGVASQFQISLCSCEQDPPATFCSATKPFGAINAFRRSNCASGVKTSTHSSKRCSSGERNTLLTGPLSPRTPVPLQLVLFDRSSLLPRGLSDRRRIWGKLTTVLQDVTSGRPKCAHCNLKGSSAGHLQPVADFQLSRPGPITLQQRNSNSP